MASKIFFSLTSGFVLGILFCSYPPASLGVLSFTLLSIALFLCGYFILKQRGTYLICIFLLLGCVGGGVRSVFIETIPPKLFTKLVGTEQVLQGKIVQEPDIRETSQRVTLEIEKEGVRTKLLVVVPLFPKVAYGEEVLVRGVVEKPAPFATDGGRTFRYDTFLAKDGIFLMMPYATLSKVGERTGFIDFFFGTALLVKHSFTEALASALPEPESALAQGMLVGGKQGLGEKLVEMFILTGLIHVVVLSGYNVMIIAETVRKLFSVFPKIVANSLAGAVVLLFVVVSGAGSASIRAGLMASIGLFARATNRTYDAVRALIIVGVAMLLVNPLLLLHDPGFQLSFVATLGLILGTPLFEKIFIGIRNSFLREILATTLAAQIAVLPLLLYHTGILSFVSLPANIAVLPLVPLGMATAAFAAVASLCIPPLAPLFGLPAYVVLFGILFLTELFAAIPFASVTLPSFSVFFLLVSYSVLFFLWWKNSTQKLFGSRQHPS